jgi:outer membrane lipoprotein-sorting protein
MKDIKTIALLATILIVFSQSARAQDAREIMEKSRDAVKLQSFEALSTLTITDPRGHTRIRQNTMASKLFEGDVEKRVIKFVSPAEVKGTGILIVDHKEEMDDMWIYLPALRKTRRIVSSEKSKSFMGSEFSNADMTAPSLSDFTYKLLGTEYVNDRECYQLESVPLDMDIEDTYGYSKSVVWVDKNDYIVQRSFYYDFEGEHFKTIETLSYKMLDPAGKKFMITEMTAENLQNKRSSRLVMDKVQLADTKDEYFSTTFLEQ